MPTLNEANVRHLLRRTEFVDRQARVDFLMSLGSIEAAVDDVMNVDVAPPSASFPPAMSDWDRGTLLAAHWLDQMVWAPRPFGERMSLFWHGHICSDFAQAYGAEYMREQIDLYRRDGLGNVAALMKTVAIQPLMLRYLDNEKNFASSPNQNFARELLELFLLGVGNYTEADVEAATAAWTGHSAHYDTRVYSFDPSKHETAEQQFLGQAINRAGDPPSAAANQTIDVILGPGVVPAGAEINAGRSTAEVSAEFLSWKLWQEFGEATSGIVPASVLAAMKSALLTTGFDIRPWVRAMLVHDEFYADATKDGLVRLPIEYSVACSVATGVTSNAIGQLWLLKIAGQAPFWPPDVSGWKPNANWINSGAMEARHRMAKGCFWDRLSTFWAHPWPERNKNYLDLPGGRFYASEIFGFGATPPMTSTAYIDRLLQLMDLRHRPASRQELIAYCDSVSIGYWVDALFLALVDPSMHVA